MLIKQRELKKYFIISIISAIFMFIATFGGLIIPNLYTKYGFNNQYLLAQVHGQDFLTLIIILPIFVISLILAMRGSLKWTLIWLGCLVYNLYTYVTYAFSNVYNDFFLIHIFLYSTALFSLIGVLMKLDAESIKSEFNEKTPIKLVGCFLIGSSLLIIFAWLYSIIPYLAIGQKPASIIQSGWTIIYAIDLGFLLPATLITGVMLLKRNAYGYIFAGILLTKIITIGLAILSMDAFMYQLNQPINWALLPIFFITTALGIILAYLFLRSIEKPGKLFIKKSTS
jgi:hypothetical protein